MKLILLGFTHLGKLMLQFQYAGVLFNVTITRKINM
jgi:hypothetical protein